MGGHRGLVAIVTKNNLNGVVRGVLGEGTTKALAKGDEISLPRAPTG